MPDAGALRHEMGAQHVAADVARQKRAHEPALVVDADHRERREVGAADAEQQAPLQRHQHPVGGQEEEDQDDGVALHAAHHPHDLADVDEEQAADDDERGEPPAEPVARLPPRGSHQRRRRQPFHAIVEHAETRTRRSRRSTGGSLALLADLRDTRYGVHHIGQRISHVIIVDWLTPPERLHRARQRPPPRASGGW
jgi:hypothetical protein